jgi:hypothetical protein
MRDDRPSNARRRELGCGVNLESVLRHRNLCDSLVMSCSYALANTPHHTDVWYCYGKQVDFVCRGLRATRVTIHPIP